MEVRKTENIDIKIPLGEIEIAIIDRLKLLDICQPGDLIDSIKHTITDGHYRSCDIKLIRSTKQNG